MTAKPRDWQAWAALETERIERAGQWRVPRAFDPSDPRGLVSFASNDYLGLTAHPAVRAAARAAIDRWGTGAGAARLIVGSRPVHDELEAELAAWKGTDAAVLFTTGFAANLGVLGTFAGPDTLVCSDELNHASLIDGRRLAGAPLAVYRHGDAAHVDELLRASDAPRAIVVTETVFSMDGDVAPVDKLAEVCAHHGALLVLDEAHAVLGPELDDATLAGIDHLRVGTLSKTLGALGGFVAGRSQFTDLLVNRARAYIFTTASTPADSAAALAAVRIVRSPEGAELRDRLRANVERLRPGHPSPIVPIVCGSEARALAAAEALAERGLLVTAIRPPTVPPGTSRLRVALSAAHTPDQVDQLATALADLFPDNAVSRPRTLVFVSGTATEVGKTWWTAATARELRTSGVAVAARKPVQSGEPGAVTDAEVLADATLEDPATICSPQRTYPLAWAPPMAARELGEPGFTTADLAGGIAWPTTIDVGFVEGVGGPRSPISDDGDNVDLARVLAPDLVVVVADAGLGTINAVRLSVDAYAGFATVVALNRFGTDLLHERNREHLVTVDGFDVVTAPRAPSLIASAYGRDMLGVTATETRGRVAAVLLLTVIVGATTLVMVEGFAIASPERAGAVVIACTALAAVVFVGAVRRMITLPMVLVASLVLLTVAVVEPPAESHDLWSYAMNGRILEHYGDSPYTHTPADYPQDPLLAQVGAGWRHTASLYGPAFTGVAAGITALAGTDLLAVRLGFQLLAAACVLAMLLLLYRRTRDPVVVALVGCNPVVMIEVVNIGRNDAIVGLALLAGMLLATRKRFVAAAVVLALGALVKITVIAALAALLLWVWRRYGTRIAAGAAAAGTIALVIPYAIVGGVRALRPVANAANRMSRASVWQFARHEGVEHLLGLRNAQRVGAVIGNVGPEALVAVGGLAVLFACSRLHDPTPELVAVGVLAAFLLAGSYVLASYAMWVIPIAAWRHRAGVSRAVLAWAALLTIAYQAVRPMPTAPDDLAVWLVSTVTLVFAIVAIGALSLAAVRRLRTPPVGVDQTGPVPVQVV